MEDRLHLEPSWEPSRATSEGFWIVSPTLPWSRRREFCSLSCGLALNLNLWAFSVLFDSHHRFWDRSLWVLLNICTTNKSLWPSCLLSISTSVELLSCFPGSLFIGYSKLDLGRQDNEFLLTAFPFSISLITERRSITHEVIKQLRPPTSWVFFSVLSFFLALSFWGCRWSLVFSKENLAWSASLRTINKER